MKRGVMGKQISYMTLIGDAFVHGAYASQLRSCTQCNCYVSGVQCYWIGGQFHVVSNFPLSGWTGGTKHTR